MKVADGIEIRIIEETNYPFDEKIKFTIHIENKSKTGNFPFHLKIPSWTKNAAIFINGKSWSATLKSNTIEVINRTWKSGDVVELIMPMHVETSTWYENAMAVEHGPLVYALKIEEIWTKKEVTDDRFRYGDDFYEVTAGSPWNFGIIDFPKEKLKKLFQLSEKNLHQNIHGTLKKLP